MFCGVIAGLLSVLSETGAVTIPSAPSAAPPIEMVSVPGGIFEMGRRDDGDDAQGFSSELPRHMVTLRPYSIGKFEITNAQFAAALNWAMRAGRLADYHGGDVAADGHVLLNIANPACGIAHQSGKFQTRMYGPYDSGDFPVILASWYGAAVCCNWLSEMEGLAPCYAPGTWERIEPVPDGYRLPTEAEWERAAAWDPAAKPSHRIYGFSRDKIDNPDANYREFRNVMGPCPTNFTLMMEPRISPVGYYDGSHIARSVSPAGCFDMSGNVWEWCHDRYESAYYAASPSDNPAGPNTGATRVERGGGWNSGGLYARTAFRNWDDPGFVHFDLGFRVARNAGP